MVALTMAAVVAGSADACGPGSSGAATNPPAQTVHAVGLLTETFVDTTRPTPASGPNPRRSSRTLITTILYPAEGGAVLGLTTDGRPAGTE